MCLLILKKLGYVFCCGCCKTKERLENDAHSNTRNRMPATITRNDSEDGSMGPTTNEERTMSTYGGPQRETTDSYLFINQNDSIGYIVNQSKRLSGLEQDYEERVEDIPETPKESSFGRLKLEVKAPEDEPKPKQQPKISVFPNAQTILVKEETNQKDEKPITQLSHQSSSFHDSADNLHIQDADIISSSVWVNRYAEETDINNNYKQDHCTQEVETIGQTEFKDVTHEASKIWTNERVGQVVIESESYSIDLRQQVLNMKLNKISTRKFEQELNIDHGEALFFVARSLNFTREELQTVRNCQSGGGQPNAQFVHYLCSTDVTTEEVLRGLNNIENTEGAHILQDIVNEKGYKYFYKLEPKETLKLFDPLAIDPTIPGAEVKGWKGLAAELDMNEEMHALAETSTNLGIYSGGEGFMQIMRAKNGTVGDLLDDLHKLNEDEQQLNLTSVIKSFEECISAKIAKIETLGGNVNR